MYPKFDKKNWNSYSSHAAVPLNGTVGEEVHLSTELKTNFYHYFLYHENTLYSTILPMKTMVNSRGQNRTMFNLMIQLYDCGMYCNPWRNLSNQLFWPTQIERGGKPGTKCFRIHRTCYTQNSWIISLLRLLDKVFHYCIAYHL